MNDVEQIFLNPGEFHFSAGHRRIGTVLGSCVAVTLWHRQAHCGGMCHFILADRGGRPRGTSPDGRYAVEAFELFDQGIARHGTRATDYEAKLFGGGNMFPGKPLPAGQAVGINNIAAARRLLEARGIPLVAEHAGGTGHRRVYFDLWNGEAWLRFSNVDKNEEAACG